MTYKPNHEDLEIIETTYKRHLPSATNNEAEYDGLILALEKLPSFVEEYCKSKTRVMICMDSKLVVEQVNLNWKCKAEHLQPLHERVGYLLAELKKNEILERIDIVWIPREENKKADQLANEAVKEKLYTK